MPILTSLQLWAESFPDQVAVAVDDDVVSYAQLRQRILDHPGSTGLTVLNRVNSIDVVADFLAAVSGSGCVAMLDPHWPAEQRAEVEGRLRGIATGSDARSAPGASGPGGGTAGRLADGPAESTFLYGFTSGTTSLPKAFRRTRRSWQRSLEHSAEVLHLTRHDRTLAPGPLTASLNLYALAESLQAGGSFHTLERFDVAAVLGCLERERISRLVAVPTVLRMLADRAVAAGRVDRGLTCIVSGGARLDAATTGLLQRWAPHATIVSYYGAAELGFVAASSVAPGDAAGSAGAGADSAVGQPFPGVSIRIADDDGRPLPAGATGTIQVASDFVCDGYLWGDDGEAFTRVGAWCTVGDQGFLDESGVLHVLGRRADMIVSAGTNVYPQEVEAALHRVPGVQAAVVTGCPDAVVGTRVVAAVIAAPVVDAARLRNACISALAGEHRPRDFFRLTELPVTTAGKVSRGLLARWIEEEDPRVVRLR
ncbi:MULTISPECIES: class I adenylate-forming enzyme family protein [unclassified Cryobacterium]|uniref:class I adenylate-forming enzyme family protein n=1 Tax=unclassified Cryobacterium TaxID=2649013 RepID=UPI00106CADD7|nr:MULTISPECIES: AMP-binding protein [unclassified Cryobacterium]TFC55512.1 long-chain fatty acid--CoA ligase [Cryobacterium sp. TMB3-1-2]TFC72932.1 long-chain fatty acid--CoA ligase [Cryobacterium sp. TMB3-15]TFC76438.1 long-chain fatty acid--CoA ligase [Cryobacterium sp. TMB3-10]TFD43653.1 long-chain fatty acid--CoA ligase [Cryobacterium sp. TMB3-12]